ncbi:MAG: glycosyltransferase family 2 protein [Calditrichia bacterium]
MHIDISIIIVNWNTKSFLLQCLASIQDDLKNYQHEIFVVDNASTDGSVCAVKNRYPQVKVLELSENHGFSYANNIALQQCRGKYVCLMNPDIQLIEPIFPNLFEWMENHPETGICAPRVLNADNATQKSIRKFPNNVNIFARAIGLDRFFQKTMFYNMHHAQTVDIIHGCFWLIRHTAIKIVGGLDERFFLYAEDLDWCKRFHTAGYVLMYLPYVRIIHYGGAASRSAPTKYFLQQFRSSLLYLQKHGNKFIVNWFLMVNLFGFLVKLIGHSLVFLFLRLKASESRQKIHNNLAGLCWVLFDRNIAAKLNHNRIKEFTIRGDIKGKQTS